MPDPIPTAYSTFAKVAPRYFPEYRGATAVQLRNLARVLLERAEAGTLSDAESRLCADYTVELLAVVNRHGAP